MSVSVAAPNNRSAIKIAPASQSVCSSACPPRLAIYLHDLSGGGVERQSLVIAEELRRRGADVTLVLHSLRGPLLDQIPAGLPVVDLKSGRTIDDIPRLAEFLRREKPDILLANFDFNNIAALLAKAIALSPTKVVICQHNLVFDAFLNSQRRLYRYVGLGYRALAPLMSKAIAVSAGLANDLHRRAGISSRRIVTINNPVIGPDFAQRAEEPVEHPWLHDPHHPVFVTAGRMVPQKDHPTLLRALALHRRTMGGRLLFLGVGPLEPEMKALVAELGIEDAVDFLGFRSDAPAWFRQADAFVLSSRSEGFGNVLVEAMGCGTPVISTDCPCGPRDILDNGRYGLLVPPGDPEAMARAMNEVGTLRARFPADLLRQRSGAYTYEACAAQYAAVFETLAPQRAWVARA
ncbi:MAG TPA: glycosyltransferase [Rhodopila sp.]|jgi:glycosyltransferase involved in cell wall biosynthesis|nr:glycosyltransferase [Rhodopila sp.]